MIGKDFQEEFNWWKQRYYKKEKIRFVKENKPLGTFGGIHYLKRWIGNSPFFLTNGDELKKIDLEKMIQFHEKYSVMGTLALVKVPNPQDYGVVLCKNGIVEDFIEKPKNPPSKYINSGLYLLSPEILNYTRPRFTMMEKDVFPQLAREGKLAGFKFIGSWMDCGTFVRYENALKRWKS